MKILIAYDGSEPAGSAITNLRLAGLPSDVEATVISVAEAWLPPATDRIDERGSPVVQRAKARADQMVETARQHAENGAGLVRNLFPDWSVRAEAVADSPAWAVIKRATGLSADLIVLGSHGYAPLTRFVFGSVSMKVVAEADCSIRVGRKGREDSGPVRILAGLDGSTDADAAIEAIAARRWPAGSEIRLLTSVDGNIATAVAAQAGPLLNWLDDDDDDETAWVNRMLDEASGRITATGLRVSTARLEGDPKQSLLREAREWNADVIFVGARGHSLFERLLLGSVSSAIVARAECSVEVVRMRPTLTI